MRCKPGVVAFVVKSVNFDEHLPKTVNFATIIYMITENDYIFSVIKQIKRRMNMYCKKCGQEIPDNTKFCNYCGADQGGVSTPQQSSGNSSKNKNTIIAVIGVIILLFATIGFFASKPSSDNNSKKSAGGSNYVVTTMKETTTRAANPAYNAIFEGTNIIHSKPFFMMDTASFAKKDSEGVIICTDYGYKNDEVKEMAETMYVPVSGLTDTEKTAFEKNVREKYSYLEGKSAITVSYVMRTNYLIVTVTYSGLDLSSNRAQMVEVGILESNIPVSMAKSEQAQISAGAVKK